MINWLIHFTELLLSTFTGTLPIVFIIIAFQLRVIRKPFVYPKKILAGFLFVLFGIAFFLEGLEMMLFPLGKLMATELTAPAFLNLVPEQVASWRNYYWLYLFAASLGFAAALAEPSLIAVAQKTEQLSGGAINAWGLRFAVSLGLGMGLALGALKIVTGAPLHLLIIAGYLVVALQTCFVPKTIIALAYDVGGVTTSTVTIPLVTAMGLGLADTLPDRDPLQDGFGLITFAILFPTIAVLGYAQLAEWLSKRNLKNNT